MHPDPKVRAEVRRLAREFRPAEAANACALAIYALDDTADGVSPHASDALFNLSRYQYAIDLLEIARDRILRGEDQAALNARDAFAMQVGRAVLDSVGLLGNPESVAILDAAVAEYRARRYVFAAQVVAAVADAFRKAPPVEK